MKRSPRPIASSAHLLALCLLLASPPLRAQQQPQPQPQPQKVSAESQATTAQLQALRDYIKKGWTVLVRSHKELLAAAVDPKFPPPKHGAWLVYVSAKEDPAAVAARLKAEMPAADFAKIQVRRLPADPTKVDRPGILYLPRPYVVPGGRFNEMYGWDSYFIVVGLLADGEIALAKDMVDNFIYEIEHYGTILNANRSYYLTRSQPPFLTRMVLDVYNRTRDRAWLEKSIPAIEKYYAYWTSPPHHVPETGLARYFDLGKGPAPEVLASERDRSGKTHYDRVRGFYKAQPTLADGYDVKLFYDRARDRLTDLFYVADRSMRESGFDPSNRFGPFNIGVIHYNPVCLNSLLYVMEKDTAQILRLAGKNKDAPVWESRADARKKAIESLLWDEAAGLYFDYDFVAKARRPYPFGTTFFPLWAGIATPKQARRVAAAALKLLEAPGGLRTSDRETGNQWDSPYGWAPLQVIAVDGLRRYGLGKDADRLAVKFISLVLKEHIEHNAIFEKYDVTRRESAVSSGIKFGYASNEIGFGWTNAAVVDLWQDLSPAVRSQVLKIR